MKHDKEVLTINVKTWAVGNAHRHRQHIVDTPFGRMNQTPGYVRGWCGYNPRHVPVIIYKPVFETGCIWEYTGQPDSLTTSYPTYYRFVKSF